MMFVKIYPLFFYWYILVYIGIKHYIYTPNEYIFILSKIQIGRVKIFHPRYRPPMGTIQIYNIICYIMDLGISIYIYIYRHTISASYIAFHRILHLQAIHNIIYTLYPYIFICHSAPAVCWLVFFILFFFFTIRTSKIVTLPYIYTSRRTYNV